MKVSALRKVDVLVGDQERVKPPKRKPFQVRQWTDLENSTAKDMDRRLLDEVVGANDDGDLADVTLQCNLLVVDPNKVRDTPSVHGFRFVNPKTLANHATRKQE